MCRPRENHTKLREERGQREEGKVQGRGVRERASHVWGGAVESHVPRLSDPPAALSGLCCTSCFLLMNVGNCLEEPLVLFLFSTVLSAQSSGLLCPQHSYPGRASPGHAPRSVQASGTLLVCASSASRAAGLTSAVVRAVPGLRHRLPATLRSMQSSVLCSALGWLCRDTTLRTRIQSTASHQDAPVASAHPL